MTNIFITGDETDNSFKLLLEGILSETYRITYIKNNSAFQWGKGYELLAADFPKFGKIEVDNPVFLLKKDCVPDFEFPPNATVIACSENGKQIKTLKDGSLHVITCGFGKTDSFSYSSLSDDSMVVSLNRELTAFSGKKIQPLEVPVTIPKEADTYSVIAFTALRILLDDFNSEIGELI
ncbi:MAG: hypothetical protein NC203_03315 [Firmicutes bacterium]|nr:hypothetical protein [Bacillota bacterium]